MARVRSQGASSTISGEQITIRAGFSPGTSLCPLPVLILPRTPTLHRLFDTAIASLNNQLRLRKEQIATEENIRKFVMKCARVILQFISPGTSQ